MGKQKIYNKSNELVKCEYPFNQLLIESNKEEMWKASATGSERRKVRNQQRV